MKFFLSLFVSSCVSSLFTVAFGASAGEFITYDSLGGSPYNVSYDERSFMINGERTLLLGGSVHYPRLSPGQWLDILTKARNDGLNHVEVYVFWNLHEPTYDLSGNHSYTLAGRANLTGFLDVAKSVGLFVNLRIGPYVCAEWSFGGLPVWLLHVPDIAFRTNNAAWESEMGIFVRWVGDLVTPYLAKNGGPIILAQIENEYHGPEQYVTWCGELALSLDFEVPWVMCNGESANVTVNTCNGNDCYSSYVPTHASKYPGQPMAWTENEGWFQYWGASGGNLYVANETGWANRSPENMAYVVATWFAAGAAHHNYYMWYGGNHVSWTAGSSITSYYADGVNYHADGLAHEPKRSHLSRLHNILAQQQGIMLADDIQYGREHYLVPDDADSAFDATIAFTLSYATCASGSHLQTFSMDGGSVLSWAGMTSDTTFCVVATGSSDPVQLVACNQTDPKQQWQYKSDAGQQIISVGAATCLDVFGGTGPEIDEYACKNPDSSDAKNQQWKFDNATGTFVSLLDESKCLTVSNKTDTFAYVYGSNSTGEKVTFLVNTGSSDYTLTWEGIQYYLPTQSVSILDTEGQELMNTGKVDTNVASQRVYKTLYAGEDLEFVSWQEGVPVENRTDSPVHASSPQEQIRLGNGSSEYLYYSSSVSVSLEGNLSVMFTGQLASAYNVWVGDEFVGTGMNGAHSSGAMNYSISLGDSVSCSDCVLTILSSSLGIHNGISNEGDADAQDKKGLTGGVWIVDGGKIKSDFTNNGWDHWIGSTGEILNVTRSGSNAVAWSSPADTSQPMTWYKTSFATPDMELFVNRKEGYRSGEVTGVLLLDIGANGMGLRRGHWWLNGMDMGHYNNAEESNVMVQQYYYIPLDYLVSDGENALIFQEELSLDGDNDIGNINVVYSTFVIPE